MTGLEHRKTKTGLCVLRLHYTADPDKRSDEWKAQAHVGLTAAAWDREMEINWTRASGLAVFAGFVRDWHVAKTELLADPREPIYRNWDFGLTPACVWFQVTPTSQLLFLHELVTWDGRGDMKQLGIEQFAPLAVLDSNEVFSGCRFVDYADPAGWAKAQTDMKSAVDLMRAEGIYPSPGPVTFTARRAAMQDRLDCAIAGQPSLLISPNCRMLIEAFQGAYRFEEIGETGRYKETVEKNAWSHPMEAACYGVASLFIPNRETRIRRKKKARGDQVTGY